MRVRLPIPALVAVILWGCAVVPAASRYERAGVRAREVRQPSPPRDEQHDFDFEFGSWSVRLRRLVDPLTGSDQWVEMQGTSVVRKIWGGGANLGELDVTSGSSRLEGLSLRLYDPATRQWRIY